jgi:polar amino acid transport system substrate-binding protein
MRKLALVAVLLATLALAACGGGDSEGTATTAEPAATTEAAATEAATTEAAPTSEAATTEAATTEAADECAKETLQLVDAGALTIGTGNPAYPPWFGGDPTGDWEVSDPASGQGYESAVAYALAEALGFAPEEVQWVPTTFNQAIAPGPKKYDFNLQQISYSKKRAKAVDFSDSYYDVNQALVSVTGSKLEGATTLDELKDATFGVPVGTTSYDYVVENIQPNAEPRVYDDQAAAVQALVNGQVDGIVTDLPTAFYLVAAEIDEGILVGQFPSVGGQEYFALAFPKDSPLVSCVNQALAAIKADGTLDAIYQEWLSDKAQAPVID